MNNVTGRAQWLIDKLISITYQLQWHRNRFGDKLTKRCYVVVVFYYLATPDQLLFHSVRSLMAKRRGPNPIPVHWWWYTFALQQWCIVMSRVHRVAVSSATSSSPPLTMSVYILATTLGQYPNRNRIRLIGKHTLSLMIPLIRFVPAQEEEGRSIDALHRCHIS